MISTIHGRRGHGAIGGPDGLGNFGTVLPLRYSMVWSLLGWAFVFTVITLSLLPGTLTWQRGHDRTSLFDKVGHAVLYCLLMVWFGGIYTRQRHLVIALALVGQSAVLELIQAQLPYRSFDTQDLLANIVGIVLGLSLSYLLLAGWCMRR